MSQLVPERSAHAGFDVRTTADGLALAGELDMGGVAALEAALDPLLSAGGDVTLDLGELDFVDSSGVNLFVDVLARLAPNGRLILREPKGVVLRLLEVSGLSRHPRVAVA